MRDLNADLRNEDLDIGHEDYVTEQAALASLAELDAVVESEGDFYGAHDGDDLTIEDVTEVYENDLEEFGRNESFADTMAELDAESYLAQYDE